MSRFSNLDIQIQMEMDEEIDSKEIATKFNVPLEWVEQDRYQPIRRRRKNTDEDRD